MAVLGVAVDEDGFAAGVLRQQVLTWPLMTVIANMLMQALAVRLQNIRLDDFTAVWEHHV